MGSNLMQILSKYNSAGSFLRSVTDILRKVNNNSIKNPNQAVSHANEIKEEDSDEPLDSQRRELRYEKQGRVNSVNPTKSGVISSPDPRQQAEIQRLNSPDFNLKNQMPKAAPVNTEDSQDDAEISSIAGGSEDFVTEESERHHVVADNAVNSVHHR